MLAAIFVETGVASPPGWKRLWYSSQHFSPAKQQCAIRQRGGQQTRDLLLADQFNNNKSIENKQYGFCFLMIKKPRGEARIFSANLLAKIRFVTCLLGMERCGCRPPQCKIFLSIGHWSRCHACADCGKRWTGVACHETRFNTYGIKMKWIMDG